MANTKITDLAAGDPAQSTDEIPVNRGGVDKKITAGSIVALTTDVNLVTSDVTTNNATTAKHGFLLKLGGGSTNFLRADGTWNAPAGGTGITIGAALALSAGLN